MVTKKSTRATKAQSRSDWKGMEGSIAHRLSESPGGIEGALERMKGAPKDADALTKYRIERTDNRIRASLASMRPLRGCCYEDDTEAANARGRSLVERLALSAEGYGAPRLRLTSWQVADVLSFMHCSEPVEPEGWWEDPDGEPSHVVGLNLVLEALEESLRDLGKTVTGPDAPESAAPSLDAYNALPHRLRDHLDDQRDQANVLLSFLERLEADDESPLCMRIAVRMASELAEALDAAGVGKVLEAAEEARS